MNLTLKKKNLKKVFFFVCSIPFGFVVVWFCLFFVFQAIADADSLLQVPSHPNAYMSGLNFKNNPPHHWPLKLESDRNFTPGRVSASLRKSDLLVKGWQL